LNYGLYISASGALTGNHMLDVASNNLANIDTVGFKYDVAAVKQRATARVEDGLFHLGSNQLLERLGGGVLAARTRTSFTPAQPRNTGNPLDAAIRGDGFFVVNTGQGEGEEAVRLTRDGRFTINPDGGLVTLADGFPVLDDNDAPIVLDPTTPARIGPDGVLWQDEEPVARIQVASVRNLDALHKTAGGFYRLENPTPESRIAVPADLEPRAVEASGVDPIRAMLAVRKASGKVTSNLRMISLQDELLNRTINTFGRVG